MSRSVCLCSMLSALLCASAASAAGLRLARTLSGGDIQYIVRKGDSLAAMGSHFGVEPSVLARANGLRTGMHLQPGSCLRVDNRHVVPSELGDGIVIDMPQRMVFLVAGGVLAAAYPAALGQVAWRTPEGDFTVVDMTVNPTWSVPVSIQRDMARRGKAVRTRVSSGSRQSPGKTLDRAESARDWHSWHHGAVERLSFSLTRMHPVECRRYRRAVRDGQTRHPGDDHLCAGVAGPAR